MWHREEETHNNHETTWRQTKQSNPLSLSRHDDYKTSIGHEVTQTKHGAIAESHNWSNNQQRINNNRTAALERTAAKV